MELNIRKAKEVIKLDGELNEGDWQTASVAKDFFLNYPVDSLPPTFQSEVRLTFDEHNLYVGIICYDDSTKDIVQSLRRDIDWGRNDNIGIFMDPFNDFTNGFFFTITPMGVQSEGTISNGGSNDDGFNDNWDNKWYSKVKRMKDRWVAEIAIPFKSLRYNLSNWNVTFLRNDVKRNQISSWIATPIQFNPGSFSYAGKLVWEELPPRHKSNISLIPYAAQRVNKDVENNEPTEGKFNFGLDAKIGLTPSLNLDLTINPDFSNVEVDRQVINLTRFEFGFPERRQFFLENSDLFSQPGFPDSRPFFTRRIGLARDTSDNIQKVPILYGARVSGKLGKNWRIGVMNMQTAAKKSLGLPDQNYSVAVVQRQVFSRSNIGFVFVNKQSLGLGTYDSTKFYHSSVLREVTKNGKTHNELNTYNRVYGVDFNLVSESNTWQGDMFYHRSADAFSEDKNYSHGVFLSYNIRNLIVGAGEQSIGKNFNAESGFVPGLDVYPGLYSGFAFAEGKFFPKETKIATMGPQAQINYVMMPDGTITDRNVNLGYNINFLNTASIGAGWQYNFQKLTEDFNPISREDNTKPENDTTLLAGQEFAWNQFNVNLQTDSRKIFNISAQTSYGQYYNGTLFNVSGSLNYRYQPVGSLSVQIDYNDIRLSNPFVSTKFVLISPRLDLTFTDKLFLTTFVQYSNRDDNVNLNARFQWRFKPASDFFVVYTENYLPGALHVKNRALVLKITYWLNL